MKKLNLLIVIALCLSVFALISQNAYNFFSPQTKSALEVIHHRTSVRAFTNEPVAAETLNTIVRAGMAAPTAGNKQPWAFVVVTDKKVLKALKNALPHGRALEFATAAIVTCCVESETLGGDAHEMWVQDCSAATQNMLLAIDSLGLGGVWLGAYPAKDRVEALRSALNVPAGVTPFSVVALGNPTGETSPKDKYKPEKIHNERW